MKTNRINEFNKQQESKVGVRHTIMPHESYIKSDGGPSWDSQDKKNWSLERGHHGLTVVKVTSPWQAPC